MRKEVKAACVFFFITAALLLTIPFILIPKTTTETYQIHKSTILIHNFTGLGFANPTNIAGIGTELNANDTITIQANATIGKNIDFFLNAVNDTNGEITATYLSYTKMTTVYKNWVVPLNSDYDFVFKSNNLFTLEDISLQVTKHWSETAYRDATNYYQLLPFEYSYVGIVIIIVGLGILGYFKKYKK